MYPYYPYNYYHSLYLQPNAHFYIPSFFPPSLPELYAIKMISKPQPSPATAT
jgi:hypothetical protein